MRYSVFLVHLHYTLQSLPASDHELQPGTSESQVGVRRRIHILAQVDTLLSILPENVDILGLESLTRPSVGAAKGEHLVAREGRQVLLVPTRVGDTGAVSRLVRVDVARPVFQLEVLEDDRAVVDSSGAWVVLVDVGLGKGACQFVNHKMLSVTDLGNQGRVGHVVEPDVFPGAKEGRDERVIDAIGKPTYTSSVIP